VREKENIYKREVLRESKSARE
jgi:hypothetical protein